jgi:colanic acid biosynthesis glycosyl transferase WcaI
MRVGILTQYYWPEPVTRLRGLVRGLLEAGDEVEVLTALPSWPHGTYYEGYTRQLVCEEHHDGTRIIRTYCWPYRGRVMWKRLTNYGSFMISAHWGARRLGAMDVLYVYHPPLTISLPAVSISWAKKAPFIYDVEDIWPEAGVAANALKPGVFYRLMERWAQWAYSRAAHITVLAPPFVDILAGQGVPPSKISVMPNWADDSIYVPANGAETRTQLGLTDGDFVVMYAGNMGSTHGVEVILEAASHLRNQSTIVFLMVGTGPEYDKLVQKKEQLGLDRVRFLGYHEPREMPPLLAAADLLIVHLKKSTSGAVSLPSRIPAYMACARPILVAADGAPRQVIEEVGCGFTCNPDDGRAMANAILIASSDRARLAVMGRRGREAYLAHFSESSVVSRLVGIVHEVGRCGAPQYTL